MKEKSKYTRVLRLVEFYQGLQMHMIDNERLNRKKSDIKSTFSMNMKDDILYAILKLIYSEDNMHDKFWHFALKKFLEKDRL